MAKRETEARRQLPVVVVEFDGDARVWFVSAATLPIVVEATELADAMACVERELLRAMATDCVEYTLVVSAIAARA